MYGCLWQPCELFSSSSTPRLLSFWPHPATHSRHPATQGGRAAAETLQQAGGALPPPEPQEPIPPVYGPAAPWEQQHQQPMAAEGPSQEAGAAMDIGPAAAAGPAAGPALEGPAPAGVVDIMKRELRMQCCCFAACHMGRAVLCAPCCSSHPAAAPHSSSKSATHSMLAFPAALQARASSAC